MTIKPHQRPSPSTAFKHSMIFEQGIHMIETCLELSYPPNSSLRSFNPKRRQLMFFLVKRIQVFSPLML